MHMTTREFIQKFDAGEFDSADVTTQIEAGWYDWFCRDASLCNKTKLMGKIIRQIKDGGKVDLDNTYVFFKNNCGTKLYDDFRICDIRTHEVLINVNIDNGYDERYAVYGRFLEGAFWEKPYVEFTNSKELVEWLNEPFEKYDAEKRDKRYADDCEFVEYNLRKNLMNDSSDTVHMRFKCTNRNRAEYDKVIEKLKMLSGYDVSVVSCNAHTYDVMFKRVDEMMQAVYTHIRDRNAKIEHEYVGLVYIKNDENGRNALNDCLDDVSNGCYKMSAKIDGKYIMLSFKEESEDE